MLKIYYNRAKKHVLWTDSVCFGLQAMEMHKRNAVLNARRHRHDLESALCRSIMLILNEAQVAVTDRTAALQQQGLEVPTNAGDPTRVHFNYVVYWIKCYVLWTVLSLVFISAIIPYKECHSWKSACKQLQECHTKNVVVGRVHRAIWLL